MLSTAKKLAPLVAAVLAGSALLAGCRGDDATPVDDGVATFKVLYRSSSQTSTKMFKELQRQLAAVDVSLEAVAETDDDFAKTLQDAGRARSGAWDIAITGRGPDGSGSAGASLVGDLFNGPAAFPRDGSNVGLLDDPDVTATIAAALGSVDPNQANKLWADADAAVMRTAAVYPVAEPLQLNYTSRAIAPSSRVFIPALQNFDPTQVKLRATPKGDKSRDRGPRVLTLLGSPRADSMDPNLSYYSIDYLGLRMWSRQLFAFSRTPGEQVPDLAVREPTAASGITDGGRTITVELRPDARWGAPASRPVVAADVVRGVLRSCNPVKPFPGLDRYRSLIEGLDAFCSGFAQRATDEEIQQRIEQAVTSQEVAGLRYAGSTVTFHLTEADPGFVPLLSLPAFSPVPAEILAGTPGDLTGEQMISNGPYQVTERIAGQRIVLKPNPAWTKASDTIRFRNFDEIVIDQTRQQAETQELLQAARTQAVMEWDNFVPVASVAALVEDEDPDLVASPTGALDPYLVFNTASSRAGGALGRVEVRQALSRAIDRSALVEAIGGGSRFRLLTHVLPASVAGSRESADLYPYDPEKAKAELAALLGG